MRRSYGLITQAIRQAFSALSELWRGASGAHAYDSYLHHVAKNSSKPLTPQEFYLDDMERKYSRPNRCC
jgi:uncharacterized short protein YbdD (DUF466 family)